jgi:hypothetical protein
MRRCNFLSSVCILALLGLSTGCNYFGMVSGSGNLTTQTFDLADFSRITAGYTFDVKVTQAAKYSVTVTVDDNLSNYLRVSKQGDVLKLEMQSGRSYPNSTMRAVVTLPRLKEITLSGASRADVANFSSKDDLHLNFSGASQASLVNMLVNSFMLELSGASNLTGEVTADGNARLNLSGASRTELNGRAGDLDLEASGASKAELNNFAVLDADINLSGASNATVNASGKLSGDLSGASHLFYLGSPILGSISTSGASSVTKK